MGGIFCLEGLWDEDLEEKCSVYPILKMVEMNGKNPFLHHRVATSGDMDYYLSRWKKSCRKSYPILYFAFHGESGMLLIGEQRYTLGQLSEKLENSCREAFIFFASCKTVNIPDETIKRFLQTTKVKGILGYRNTVVWIISAAFEILLLSEIVAIDLTPNGLSRLKRRADVISNNFKKIDLLFATEKRIHRWEKNSSRP